MGIQTIRRRRRPGDLWQLYRIDDGNRSLGYLVTGGKRNTQPIAYIDDFTPNGLRLALSILCNNAKAKLATDMRSLCPNRLPRIIKGKLLWPVDSLGRVIGNDRTFAAASYLPAGMPDQRFNFVVFAHPFFEKRPEGMEAQAVPPCACKAGNLLEAKEILGRSSNRVPRPPLHAIQKG